MISSTTREQLISLLDLTSLNDTDTDETTKTLCQYAQTSFGHVAAVCIYPKFVSTVKNELVGKPIQIATVVNFPHGTQQLQSTLQETSQAIANGANEIDLVLPYQDFLQGKKQQTQDYLKQCRNSLSNQYRLKVIIESGAYHDPNDIALATQYVIETGGDFVKTSTGKYEIGATPEAAETILKTIKAVNPKIGFKVSGGIRQVADALIYLRLVEKIMGESWAQPTHFRIGASKLIHELLA